jgi:hypothetical protein
MLIRVFALTHCFYVEAPRARSNRVANQVPDEILNDPLLNKSIETVNLFFLGFYARLNSIIDYIDPFQL